MRKLRTLKKRILIVAVTAIAVVVLSLPPTVTSATRYDCPACWGQCYSEAQQARDPAQYFHNCQVVFCEPMGCPIQQW